MDTVLKPVDSMLVPADIKLLNQEMAILNPDLFVVLGCLTLQLNCLATHTIHHLYKDLPVNVADKQYPIDDNSIPNST